MTSGANALPESLARLRADLDRISQLKPRRASASGHVAQVHGGYELRTDPHDYRWHGLRRGGSRKHPVVLFQYGLEGWGEYWSPKTGAVRLGPGQAFTAVVPSLHEYYLPDESPGWRFVWLMISHPYVVSRIARRQESSPPIWTVPADNLLAGITVRIFEAYRTGGFASALDEEHLLLDFMIAYERFGTELEHPAEGRLRMLESVKRIVEADLRHPVSIENIAAEHGMSRSHFSHRFRRITGLVPAQYILQVRLGHVVNLLTHTRLKLEAVAAELGFASATHLCRVFRRHYHISPDAFRRQSGVVDASRDR